MHRHACAYGDPLVSRRMARVSWNVRVRKAKCWSRMERNERSGPGRIGRSRRERGEQTEHIAREEHEDEQGKEEQQQ